MRAHIAAFTVVGLVSLAVPAAEAELRYLGLNQGAAAGGVIHLGGQLYAVDVGEVIPNWGTVATLDADEIVVKRVLSGVEKEALRAQGKAVYDVQHMHVRNIYQMLPHVGTTPR